MAVLSCNPMRGMMIGLGVAMALGGCKDDEPSAAADTGSMCVGAKCDELEDGTSGGETTGGEPVDDSIAATCGERRDDAFNPNKLAFTPGGLRWSCDDVPSVLDFERGQEYCEYFAVVALPSASGPVVLGRNLGAVPEDGQTSLDLGLDTTDIAELEADPAAIVGQCVFTSWNSDEPQPGCAVEPCVGDSVLGVPVAPEDFRMKYDVNSTEAAVNIISDCLDFIPDHGDFADPDDPLHDAFTRACYLNAEINETQWRKSDNIICTATVRLAECGCQLTLDDGTGFADALPKGSSLGFPLGTWSGESELPSGCAYVDPGDGSHHVVACDLTAAEVLTNADELKAYCAETYGPNVVVHVPVDAALVECMPDQDVDPYAATCPAEPWVVE